MAGQCPLREDPVDLIGQALAMGPDFPGPAEDVLLSWMLKLDDELDPVAAAAVLLRHYGVAEGPVPAGEAGRLIVLLRKTAACPPGAPRPSLGRRRRRPRD